MSESSTNRDNLGAALGSFANRSLDNPYTDDTPDAEKVLGTSIQIIHTEDTKKKKKKKDHGISSDIDDAIGVEVIEDSGDDLRKFVTEGYDPMFDDYIEDLFEEDEDTQLKNSLISLGRKYARMTSTDVDTSEVSKAYSKQEQALEAFIEDIERDSVSVQQDIDRMRLTRSRNYKALSDLISAKASYYNAKLSAIKELNSMTKSKYDISMKMKKGEGDTDTSNLASQAVQKLLGSGHKALIDAVGGRAEVSGAIHGDEYEIEPTSPEELYDDVREGSSEDYDDETDGDKFIKYENDEVEYVVDFVSDSKRPNIYAINKDGDVVPDYPLPNNIDELAFNINELSGYATDQLHRSYRVRYDGVDLKDTDRD